MKCPSCGTRWKHADGMMCGCGYQFVFDPKTEGLADGRFAAVLRRASANGTRYFTVNQLYSEFARRSRPSAVGPFVAAGLASLLLLGALLYQRWGLAALGVLFTLLLVGVGVARQRARPMPKERFDQLLARWIAAKGHPDRLITTPRLDTPPPEWAEHDMYDYGVRCILLVDRPEIVDLLVLNGLHTQEGALVLSMDGYPQYLTDRAEGLLAQYPDLPVYLLHDATSAGIAAAQRFHARPSLPVEPERVIDLGLYPSDTRHFRRLKQLGLGSGNEQAPLDLLPYPTLQRATHIALVAGVSIGVLAMRQAAGGGGTGGDGATFHDSDTDGGWDDVGDFG
jgi:hypothetical protein